jgi:hypothetical protein
MDHERITAEDVQVGDWICPSRTRAAERVVKVEPGPVSVYITFPNGSRIRPRKTTKLWRVNDWMVD